MTATSDHFKEHRTSPALPSPSLAQYLRVCADGNSYQL